MKISSPTLHLTILFGIVVFVAIVVMAFVFKVEVVARGEGRVVPITQVQVVQPEFAGSIRAIHVRDGMPVSKGQILIELDPTDAISELGKLTAEMQRLQIEALRVDAMVGALLQNVRAPDFLARGQALFDLPQDLSEHPFVAEQEQLLEAELRDFLAVLEQIDAREDVNRRSEEVTSTNIARVQASLEIQSERLERSQLLLDQGTSSRAAFLDVQQAFTELERERDVYLRELGQKVAERTALNSERRARIAEIRSNSLGRQSEIDSRLATLGEEERAARRRVVAAQLKAPVSGIVDQLQVFTVGGVADAGAELLRIVPTNVEIEIEGLFSNQDIGFMEVGQRTNIRLDAYPSERFGFVEGQISDIAADSTQGEDGQWGYVVRATPDDAYLSAGSDQYALRPGMTATIDVTTDTRRIISYFFAPIVRTVQDAMGER
ncbi:HlyD family type I secretion periplasmic adaptor subunit [uncultured Tateyamaria sp.]|uniref:HlyD family type I secretion periplasmic adaptor subunit n=1 Tax=uncultured Tateyamaria sp. TaxID=455651 RepID=UPI00260196AD|nr:HlyD family type I secretion periplasmic adaptor subunit [uncultured Tateyamaria sp.]